MRSFICRKATWAMETFSGIVVINAALVPDDIGGGLPARRYFERGLEK
jgi:hypothetical protein